MFLGLLEQVAISASRGSSQIIPKSGIELVSLTVPSILKEIGRVCSLEGMMLKLKLQYFGHLIRRVDSLEKTDVGRDWGQEEKGTTEDEMVGWHH